VVWSGIIRPLCLGACAAVYHGFVTFAYSETPAEVAEVKAPPLDVRTDEILVGCRMIPSKGLPRSLADLVGIRAIWGVLDVLVGGLGGGPEGPTLTEGPITLLRVDGDVLALFDREPWTCVPKVGVRTLEDGLWPFSVPEVKRIALEMFQTPARPIVCNFMWEPASSAICAVDEARNLIVLRVGERSSLNVGSPFRRTRAQRTQSHCLSLNSSMNVLPNQSAQITNRVERAPFRPQSLVIRYNASDWIVEDIRIGGLSQLPSAGGLPGRYFAMNSSYTFITFTTAQVSMHIDVVVTYVGEDPHGQPFVGSFLGIKPERVPAIKRRSVAHWTPEGVWESWMAADVAEVGGRPISSTGR
jgi:hypothetical protein